MSRLRRMDVDFAAAQTGASWSGVVALLLGLAAFVYVVATHQQTLDRTATLEAQAGVAAGKHRPADGAALGQDWRRRGEMITRANAVARELGRRWDRVFLALESASVPEVALLAIEPEPRKDLIRITAEARGKPQMLRYLERLQAAEPLRRVMLERHDVLVDAPEKPVRFVVSASWEIEP